MFSLVVAQDGGANGLDLADVVGQYDGGRGPAAEELLHAPNELLRIVGVLQVGVQLAEVILERSACEMQQSHTAEDGECGGHDDDAARTAVDPATEKGQTEGGARRALLLG